jgi:3-hydroxypropanoate dehydrogenase
MATALPDDALDTLFREARTHSSWSPAPVGDEDLRAIYDLAKMGPTSANGQPFRIVFVRSPEAKERLKSALAPGNVDKTMSAPVTAIFGYDLGFHELFPETFPVYDMRANFVGKPEMVAEHAVRNGSLQAAYFMIAARALGFDVGGMSGFNRDKVDELFFAGTAIKSNFLCNIGHGDGKALFPRLPRLAFDRTCRVG